MLPIDQNLFSSNITSPPKSSGRKKYLLQNEKALTELISALAISQPSDVIMFIYNWASQMINDRPKPLIPASRDRAPHSRPNLGKLGAGFNEGS